MYYLFHTRFTSGEKKSIVIIFSNHISSKPWQLYWWTFGFKSLRFGTVNICTQKTIIQNFIFRNMHGPVLHLIRIESLVETINFLNCIDAISINTNVQHIISVLTLHCTHGFIYYVFAFNLHLKYKTMAIMDKTVKRVYGNSFNITFHK